MADNLRGGVGYKSSRVLISAGLARVDVYMMNEIA